MRDLELGDAAAIRTDIVLDDGPVSSIWATKTEWLGLIVIAGLAIEAIFGDFNGMPLHADSHEYVFVTTRPGSG
jgi:hypothetical protein